MKCLTYTLLLLLFCFSLYAEKQVDSSYSRKSEFIPNMGQWHKDVMFKSIIDVGSVFFVNDGFVVATLNSDQFEAFHHLKNEGSSKAISKLDAAAYKVSLVDAQPFMYQPVDSFYHFYNYFLSKNNSTWSSYVYPSSSIYANEVYSGISVRYYQRNGYLKYEFIADPKADVSQIKLRYDGVKSVSLSSNTLVVKTAVSRIVELAPVAYQIQDNEDTAIIDCKYVLKDNVVSYALGDYDHNKTLIIDPVVVFSSYSGSVADNWGYTATYDSRGNLYGGGITFGIGYPTTLGAYQVDYCQGSESGTTDVSISKFDSSGQFLHYATYLGGSYSDIPHSLYVNDNDELYIFGTTASSDFPVTPNAFDTSFNGGSSIVLSTSLRFPYGSDIFVSKLSADGSQLLASTFVGGSSNDGVNVASGLQKNYADDNRGEILVDENSNVYVVSSTWSTDFPVTPNAFCDTNSGGQDVCIFKLTQDLSQMIWSTYVGGSDNDAGYSMMLASDQTSYFCGGTKSLNFPIANSCLQDTLAGGVDGFIAHISSNGSHLLHSTYLGREGYDQTYLVKGDKNDVPYVFGQTDAQGDTWITNAQYYTLSGGQFLTKLLPSLDGIEWSTAFGTGNGGPDISPTALLVDYCNNIYMSGWGSHELNHFGGTSGLPITNDAFQNTTDGSDYYFISLSDDASQLIYGSYFGGAANSAREHVDGGTSRFDRKGRIYQAVCAGCGGQSTFPTTWGAYSMMNGSTNCNLGVIKMDFSLPVVVADFHMPSAICAPDTVHFQNFSQTVGNTTSCYWNFGDGANSTLLEPSHVYTHSGYYAITLIVRDLSSCNLSDTLTKHLLVLANTTDTLSPLSICDGEQIQIGLPPSLNVDYSWSPANTLSSATLSNPIAQPEGSTWYTLIASSATCTDTIRQRVEVDSVMLTVSSDTTICLGGSALLNVDILSSEPITSIEWSESPVFSTVMSNNQNTITVSPTEQTTFWVRVTAGNCTKVGSVTVSVSKVDVLPLTDQLICFDEDARLSAVYGSDRPCTLQWTLGDGATFEEESPYVHPESTTSYTVIVTNDLGCVGTATGQIVVREGTFPTELDAWCDYCDIIQGEETQVFATDYGVGYSYQWSPNDHLQNGTSAIAIVAPRENMSYIVQVTDSFGCSKTDTVTIHVVVLSCDNPYVYVPNAFSPNGDGLNDVLYVRSRIIKECTFVVYSRWGQKLFETMDMEVGWDGTFNGKPCQNGVYDYYLKVTCINDQENEIKGNVMLVR